MHYTFTSNSSCVLSVHLGDLTNLKTDRFQEYKNNLGQRGRDIKWLIIRVSQRKPGTRSHWRDCHFQWMTVRLLFYKIQKENLNEICQWCVKCWKAVLPGSDHSLLFVPAWNEDIILHKEFWEISVVWLFIISAISVPIKPLWPTYTVCIVSVIIYNDASRLNI